MKKFFPLFAFFLCIGSVSIAAEESFIQGVRDHEGHERDVRAIVDKKLPLAKLTDKQLRELRGYLFLYAKELDNGDRAKPFETLETQLHTLWCEKTLLRTNEWAKDKRVDLLIDFAPFLKTEKQAEKLLPEFLSISDPLVNDLQARYKEVKGSLITTESIEKSKEKTEIKIVEQDKRIGHQHVGSGKFFLYISLHGKLSNNGYNDSILIVPDQLEIPDKEKRFYLDRTLVFTNSTIKLNTLWNSILIADGDVQFNMFSDVEKSVAIVRGNITSQSSPFHGQSIFCTNGRLDPHKLGINNKFFEKKRPAGEESPTKFIERLVEPFEKHPYRIRWFDLSEVGVTAKIVEVKRMLLLEKVLQLDKLTKDSPFAKQGLKEKDIILEVHGEKPRDADHFRKLVRLAGVREFAVFTIDREGKKFKYLIYFDDLFIKK